MFPLSLRRIATFIGERTSRILRHFRELSGGPGPLYDDAGTPDDLARLVITLANVGDRQLLKTNTPPGFHVLNLMRLLLGDTEDLGREPSLLPPLWEKFLNTLRHHKGVPPCVCVMAIRVLLGHVQPDTPEAFQETFTLLERLLDSPHGYQWLPVAIRIDILGTTMMTADQLSTDNSVQYSTNTPDTF